MNERIKAINEVLYCDKCDKDHPCIWINSESVAFNTTCPNDADWRPMFMGNHHALSQLRKALNDMLDRKLEERVTTLEETVKRLEESIRKTAMQSYINSGEYEP